MGLDMYLYRRTYVKNWDHTRPADRHKITVKKGGVIRKDIKPERISGITEDVAYWRKSNAVHRWFVDNCQDGVDDCREACVSKEQLAELVRLCKQTLGTLETVEGEIHTGTTYYADGRVVEHKEAGSVVAQKKLAEGLLPTQGGFFFGSTEYDECYLEDLKETVSQLEPLLDDEDGSFYYHASW